jgi:hypothetical protein
LQQAAANALQAVLSMTFLKCRAFYMIMHDQKSEDGFLLKVKDGEYNKSNEFWTSHDIMEVVAALEPEAKAAATAQIDRIKARYAAATESEQVISSNIPF